MIDVKIGDKVILHLFTGVPTGKKEIVDADEKTFTIVTSHGDTIFSKETGYQILPECKMDRYRNFCTIDDGSLEKYLKKKQAKRKGKRKSQPKKTKTRLKNENEDFSEYKDAVDEYEYIEG